MEQLVNDLTKTPEAKDDPVVISPSDTPTQASHQAVGRWEAVALVLLGVFGVAMRIWILGSPLGGADADESVVGLMARNFLDGHVSIYFWGQAYGGSQEAILAAGVFSIFGSSTIALKAVPIALSVISAYLLWRIGKRTVGDAAARWGALLFWATPFAFMWITTKERGFYACTMVCGLAVILCALRLAETNSKLIAACLGLAAGLGVWSSPQVAYLLIPTLLWLAVRRFSAFKLIWVAAPTFLLGAAPAIAFNIKNPGKSFDIPPVANAGSYGHRVLTFFNTGLPMFFGLKVPYKNEWALNGAKWAFPVLCLLVVAGVAWAVIRSQARKPLALLVLAVAIYPFVFAISPWSAYVREPRYVYFFSAPASLLIAAVFTRMKLAAVWAAMAACLCVVSMMSLVDWSQKWSNHDLASDDLGTVIQTLEAQGDSRVYADYWLAYRLTLESKNKVLASPITQIRQPSITNEVDSFSGASTYVMYATSDANRSLQSQLENKGVTATTTTVGRVVIYQLSARIPRSYLDTGPLAA